MFGKAKWDQLQEVMDRVAMREDMDSVNNCLRTSLVGAATEAIPKTSGIVRRKADPRWTEE